MNLEDFVISKWTAQDVRDIATEYFFNKLSDDEIIAISKRLVNAGKGTLSTTDVLEAIEEYIHVTKHNKEN